MKLQLAVAALMFSLPGLFSPGDVVKIAADPGTQTTLSASTVVLKARDGRKFAQIVSLKSNSTNVSCKLQSVYGTDPTATTTNIILTPGDTWDTSGGPNAFGGSVACINVSGSPVVTTTDF